MSAETYEEVYTYGGLAGRFATIDSAEALGGYEWDQFHVLRGADGFLYIGSGMGCSCNYFGESDGSDFDRVASWQDAATKAQEWAKEDGDWSAERRVPVVMDLIERLARQRPVAHIEIDLRDPFGGAR